MKIAVVYGGYSPESSASQENARAIALALHKAGHKATLLAFNENAASKLQAGYDLVFVATQGKYHGDGSCQAVCDLAGIPYTGTRAAAAALINDKALCKIVCAHAGLPTPPFLALRHSELRQWSKEKLERSIVQQIGFPAVAKPATQGGSYGIGYLARPADLPLVWEAFRLDDKVIVEKYIPGVFVTASLLEVQGAPLVLPLLTAKTRGGPLQLFTGEFQIEPADFTPRLTKTLQDYSLRLFRLFEARGYARIDFMVEEETGVPWFLEINAVPGLRGKSFFPVAAELAGYDMQALCSTLVEEA